MLWFGPRLPGSGPQLSSDVLWLQVAPSYASSNQTVKQAQGAKGAASVVDIMIATEGRDVAQLGTQFELVAGTVGPVKWKGQGGTHGYSVIGFTFNACYLNASVDNANPFYFGVRTGGSVPRVSQPTYLGPTFDARGNVQISGAIPVLNGGQLASQLWPIVSGAGAWADSALGWTEQTLLLWDTGIRL